MGIFRLGPSPDRCVTRESVQYPSYVVTAQYLCPETVAPCLILDATLPSEMAGLLEMVRSRW